MKRAMFYFLWGSKWERLRREVVKKRPEKGGKGLPDPYLFLTSKFTALHMAYATTPSRDNKTATMVKFWMGSYLRTKEYGPGRSESRPRPQSERGPPRPPEQAQRSVVDALPGDGIKPHVRHVLWECSVARDLWARTGPLQCPSLPAAEVHPRVYRLAVNGVGQGLEKLPAAEFTTLWLTLTSVTAALWTSRDLLVGKQVTVPLRRQSEEGAGATRRGSRPPRAMAPVNAPPTDHEKDGASGTG
ncbi:uncharacterized protein LOC134312196 [Trichomycterus rosablanca]|uniref:uncharacterized protein LOC134312196 n=1 Tax=Trichomycterus rosablanca TaxID=2290929 RepID=UPI002F34F727